MSVESDKLVVTSDQGPAELNFAFYQGDDESRTITWQDKDENPFADLTGAKIEMQIRKGSADSGATIIAEVNVGDGVTITDGPAATFVVRFEGAKTILLVEDQDYFYDLQVTPVPPSDKKTILKGRVNETAEVTRI